MELFYHFLALFRRKRASVNVSELPDLVLASVMECLPMEDVLAVSECSQTCLEQFSGKDILTSYLRAHSIPLNGYLPLDAYRRHLYEISSFAALKDLSMFRLIHLEKLRRAIGGLSEVDEEVDIVMVVCLRALENYDVDDEKQRECIKQLLEQIRGCLNGMFDGSKIMITDLEGAYEQSLHLFEMVKEIQEDTIKYLESQWN
eukprot:GEMP01023221.1.p1 GENE.GEMP01023221.1~~GEMP01023221.1.p1  ORF type:complete len:202 (+),score=9.78 GEMP01023221.1:165-770(+)